MTLKWEHVAGVRSRGCIPSPHREYEDEELKQLVARFTELYQMLDDLDARVIEIATARGWRNRWLPENGDADS